MSEHTHIPIPDDWIEQCHRSKDWCETFLAKVNDNRELEKLYGGKMPQVSVEAQEEAIAKQCAGFPTESPHSPKERPDMANCYVRKALLYQFESAYPPSCTSSTLWIGLAVGVAILLLGAFLLYWLFFRNKEEPKETKSKGDKIDSHKSGKESLRTKSVKSQQGLALAEEAQPAEGLA